MKLARIVFYSVLLVATPAWAASAPGTLATGATPITHGGNRTGCEVLFTAVIEDHIYRQGAWVHLSGSFILNGFSANNALEPSLTVKLVVNDMTSVTGDYKLSPSAPTTVILMGKGEVSNRSAFITSAVGETPGSLLTAFRFDDTFALVLARILDDNQLVIAFNRREGGKDVRVPIDLSIESWSAPGAKHSDATRSDFLACAKGLLNEINEKVSVKINEKSPK